MRASEITRQSPGFNVAALLAGAPVGTHRLPCPECGKGPRDRAFAGTVQPDGSLVWYCHRCGFTGSARERDGFALPRRQPRRPSRPGPTVPAGFPDRAAELWERTRPIEPDTPAGRYLAARGCAFPHEAGDLRWHPALRHPSGHVGPGLVGLVTDALTGARMSLHRTWLKPDGSGKAAVEPARLLLKGCPKAGGVIRLFPDEHLTTGLCVAEGIETALSAALGFRPVWAIIDAANLGSFPVLPGVECLTIIADHDRPNPRTGRRAGPEAAEACARRWAEAGAEARVWQAPDEGDDFNDFLARAA